MNLIFVMMAFVCGFAVYRTGFKDGQAASKGAGLPRLFPKKREKSYEEERLNRGMENILNYANRKRKGDEVNG